MAWTDIDIGKLIQHNITPVLSQAKQKAWIAALLSPIETLNDVFSEYRAKTIREMQYNGQTIILENMLNDHFDTSGRGIYIETVEAVDSQVYIGQSDENEPIYIGQSSEETDIYIGQPNESYTLSYDFVVKVPDGILTDQQEIQLKSLTHKYKLASKRPRFEYYNGQIF